MARHNIDHWGVDSGHDAAWLVDTDGTVTAVIAEPWARQDSDWNRADWNEANRDIFLAELIALAVAITNNELHHSEMYLVSDPYRDHAVRYRSDHCARCGEVHGFSTTRLVRTEQAGVAALVEPSDG